MMTRNYAGVKSTRDRLWDRALKSQCKIYQGTAVQPDALVNRVGIAHCERQIQQLQAALCAGFR
jgi:hypothetical protein